MSWFPVDDALHGHPKARKAGLESLGLWTVSGSYCMAYLTDGFVPEWFVKEKPHGLALAKRLVDAGLWLRGEKDGENGYWFHEWRTENTKEQVLATRRAAAARQEVARNPELRKSIRDRDGDICQYCRTPVEWNNRRGPTGGTYDHVDPVGGTTLENLVVCCRGCNARKGKRTPQEAGMPLIRSRSDLNQNLKQSKYVLNQTHANPSQPNKEPLVTSSTEVTLGSPPPNARGSRLPADWTPNPDVVAQMRSDHPHTDLKAEHAKFIDYWQSKAGKDARKTDWNATWRNWIRRAAEQRAPNGINGYATPNKLRTLAELTQQQRALEQSENPEKLTSTREIK